jgi:hypothetical protein
MKNFRKFLLFFLLLCCYKIGDRVWVLSSRRPLAYTNETSKIVDIYTNKKGERIYLVEIYLTKKKILLYEDEIVKECDCQ